MSQNKIKQIMPRWLKLLLLPFYKLLKRIQDKYFSNYRRRIYNETARFNDEEEVNDLPEIFHYWSNRYLRPELEQFGFSHPDGFFKFYAVKAYQEKAHSNSIRILSIGAGNCDTEVRLAIGLVESGIKRFKIECMDINEAMFQRGLAMAKENNVAEHIEFLQADFNKWNSEAKYDLVIANQSLHHVVELEHLFAQIKSSLTDSGYFITSDIIGRNGHQRWPEAVKILKQIWREMPKRYRYNHQLDRQQYRFINHDCSEGSFEGIRAQDVLPLLFKNFHFETFIPFANLILILIDRGFGPNFDVDNPEDIAFIDRIHELDEKLILAGTIQPTQLMAAMQIKPRAMRLRHPKLTPEFCLRK
jgi:2-polyprenyl-3-methyl-5-hydroxy-6-metoxy-1,4-benzoquinol methylase